MITIADGEFTWVNLNVNINEKLCFLSTHQHHSAHDVVWLLKKKVEITLADDYYFAQSRASTLTAGKM